VIDPAALGLRTATGGAGPVRQQTLGQQEFLTLLTTQLRNQDPLSPMDNEAFVAQLAQFATVSGITEMNSSLAELSASQARAQAPQWLDRIVTGPDGSAGRVTAVRIDPDNGLTLALDNGATLAVGQVGSIAAAANTDIPTEDSRP
jgi:flagellar basal-body rod modification protein FlgD